MLILITASTVGAFGTSLVLRMMGKKFWITFLATSVIVDLAIVLYSNVSGGLLADPYSTFENFRIVFLCFLGCMFAELVYSLAEELKQFAKE
jgi:hypothetical protein